MSKKVEGHDEASGNRDYDGQNIPERQESTSPDYRQLITEGKTHAPLMTNTSPGPMDDGFKGIHSPPLEEADKEYLTQSEETRSATNNPLYEPMKSKRNIQAELKPDKPTLKEFDFQKEIITEANTMERISADCLYEKHICNGKASVSSLPCNGVVSGIEKCGKTMGVKCFLNQAVKIKDETMDTSFFDEPQPHINRECLSCYKAVVLGRVPFENLTWILANENINSAVICLMSYFAKLCKNREYSPQTDYHRLLEFAPVPATSENINGISDLAVSDQLKKLYADLHMHWMELKNDQKQQEVLPTGVCLLNIFDVGPCKAAQELLPFINKYCNNTVHIVCYDSTRDADELKREFGEGTSCSSPQSKKYQLMRQICGIEKRDMVVVCALDKTNDDKEQEDELAKESRAELAKALEEAIGIDKVDHLHMTMLSTIEMRKSLEQMVKNAPFDFEAPINYLLLFQMVQSRAKTFWVKREDFESLSEVYGMKNGDLEKCLQFLTSFGTILYTSDIPPLKKYVIVDIVEFVRQMHKIYHSTEEASPFGLFQWKNSSDHKIIFEFLTTLGIAVDVRSNRIASNLPMITNYLFIPNARNVDEYVKPILDDSTVKRLSLRGCTKENLLVCLSKHLLETQKCLLVPTESINTLAFRFDTDNGEDYYDIEFTDTGSELAICVMDVSSRERRDELLRKFLANFPFLKSSDEMDRQAIIKCLQLQRQCGPTISTQVLIDYVQKQLMSCSFEEKVSLSTKLGHDKQWLQQEVQDREEWVVLFSMMNDFISCHGTQTLLGKLASLNISLPVDFH